MSRKTATSEGTEKIPFEVVDLDAVSPAEEAYGELFDSRLIGQPEARQIALDVRARYRNPMRNRKHPLGIYYLVGKSRRGKSLLAQVLAHMFHGDEDALTRITAEDYYDDSQMMDLIGAPPKYVGYRPPVNVREMKAERLAQVDGYSKVTDWNRIRVRINSSETIDIVVIEEFSKSGKDFFKFWMEVFDKGRKVLGNGEACDFSNTVFILTDNLGMDKVEKEETGRKMGFVQDEAKKVLSHEAVVDIVKDEMKKRFPPEFRNRIDSVTVYRELTAEETMRIVDIQVEQFADRIVEQMPRGDDFTLDVQLSARKFLLAEADEDVANLKRTIMKHIEVPMGRLLDRDNPDKVVGGDLVRVTHDGKSNRLTFAIARGCGDVDTNVEGLRRFLGDTPESMKGVAFQRRLHKARASVSRAKQEDWSVILTAPELDDVLSEGSALHHELKETFGLKICNFSVNYEAPYAAVYIVRGTKEEIELFAQMNPELKIKKLSRELMVLPPEKK